MPPARCRRAGALLVCGRISVVLVAGAWTLIWKTLSAWALLSDHVSAQSQESNSQEDGAQVGSWAEQRGVPQQCAPAPGNSQGASDRAVEI